jgi:hypothetical protein
VTIEGFAKETTTAPNFVSNSIGDLLNSKDTTWKAEECVVENNDVLIRNNDFLMPVLIKETTKEETKNVSPAAIKLTGTKIKDGDHPNLIKVNEMTKVVVNVTIKTKISCYRQKGLTTTDLQ